MIFFMSIESLEAKLRAIQDLKWEQGKYIGTQEALEYINAIELTYKNPHAIADIINQKLKKEFNNRIFLSCY